MGKTPIPTYANTANCRLVPTPAPLRFPFSRNMTLTFDTLPAFAALFRTISVRFGFRAEFSRIEIANPIRRSSYSISQGRLNISNRGNGIWRVRVIIAGVSRPNLIERWIDRVIIRIGADTYDLRPQFPFRINYADTTHYETTDTKNEYPDNIITAEVTAITADMFDLGLGFSQTRPNLPLYVDIPDIVMGAGDANEVYRVPDALDVLRLRGHVDNRVMGAWKFSLVSPNSLPLFVSHAHFVPFVSPTEMVDLRQMGIQVWIDEFGIVTFQNRADFERYQAAHRAAAKFNRSWIASKGSTKAGYAAVASELPDRLVASKPTMVSRFNDAIDSDQYEASLQRYRNPEVLSELFASRLDAITEINQAKLEKVVRSVEKKRDLADRLNGIIEYYRTNPDSSVILPTGLSDAILRSLISQPLSKLMATLNDKASDAYLGEAIANDLIDRLGFTRRVGA